MVGPVQKGEVVPGGASGEDSAHGVPKSKFLSVKTVGRRRAALTPAECVRRSWILEQEVDKLNPHPRPRGFVFKARTWEDWSVWRSSQANPRLW